MGAANEQVIVNAEVISRFIECTPRRVWQLATEGMPKIETHHIDKMEEDIDFFNENLPTLKSFVLPGGSQLNIWFHISRTLCRKCERTIVSLSKKESIDSAIVKYLNRLSDALFVWSRWVNVTQLYSEVTWNPNEK